MKRLLLLAAAFLLTGCFVSEKPLIAPQAADYPVKDGAHFDGFVPAGKNWIAKAGRTVHRNGEYYFYQEDGDDEKSPLFLLKGLGKNRYALQVADSSGQGKTTEYWYALVEFDGKTAIQYSGMCPARAEWVMRKLLDRIVDTSPARCIASNFESLAVVLDEAAKNAAPEAKFVLSR